MDNKELLNDIKLNIYILVGSLKKQTINVRNFNKVKATVQIYEYERG